MTDLIERLLHAKADGFGTENLCIEAVDEIERLRAERDAWKRRHEEVCCQLDEIFGEKLRNIARNKK